MAESEGLDGDKPLIVRAVACFTYAPSFCYATEPLPQIA